MAGIRHVCLLVVIHHALTGAAQAMADVRFHGNAALQHVRDQLLDNLDLAGDSSSTLVTHAMTPTLTHSVPRELLRTGYGRFGAGGMDMHRPGGRQVTAQGLPLAPSTLILNPSHPLHAFHDVRASPALVMTPHGDGVMITPVSKILYPQHPQMNVPKKQQPKPQADAAFHHPKSTPGIQNSYLRSEKLLKNLLQRNLQLKQQQEEQQRQHLKQQQESQQQLQQHQHRQRLLLQLLARLVQQKQQAERRGLDPQTVRAIVREELEQHRRQQGEVAVNNIHHVVTPPEHGKQGLGSLSDMVSVWRSAGSGMGLHHHPNGSVSFLFNFPSWQHLTDSLRQAGKSGQGLSSFSAGSVAKELASLQGTNTLVSGNTVLPPQGLQSQQERLQLQQLQLQQHQQQQQKQPQQQQQERQQKAGNEQQADWQQLAHFHQLEPQQAQNQSDRSSSSSSSPLPPSPIPSSPLSSSPSSPLSSPEIPKADNQTNNEINRPLFQLDIVLPVRSPQKQVPIHFNKPQQVSLVSSSPVSPETETLNSTGKQN